jgi:Core-2/I-Branching enzyme
MKIAYIIVAHKNPGQIIRLVDRLDDRDVSFFIHINTRTEEVFNAVFRALNERSNVYWAERYPVVWGGFGLVRAFLSGMREICKRNMDFDFIVNPSGQDYPIKSNQGIAQRLSKHVGKQLLENFELPSPDRFPESPDGGLERIEPYYFWIGEKCIRVPPHRFSGLPWKRRRVPHGLKLYGGSAWWCLSSKCIKYIDEFVQSDIGRDLIKFFEHTLASAEMFVQTVVMNSYLKDTVLDTNLWFVEWPGGSNPKLLETRDYEKLRSSDKLFARKFDMLVDAGILDLIDRDIGPSPNSQSLR